MSYYNIKDEGITLRTSQIKFRIYDKDASYDSDGVVISNKGKQDIEAFLNNAFKNDPLDKVAYQKNLDNFNGIEKSLILQNEDFNSKKDYKVKYYVRLILSPVNMKSDDIDNN